MKKLLSGILASLMVMSAFVGLYTVPASADEAPAETVSAADAIKTVYATAEEKLATMTKQAERGDYALYVLETTGEVAFVNEKTGQILLTNPYDLAASHGSSTTKESLISQIIVKYTDKAENTEKTFKSYNEAALRSQIKVKPIKNGVRLEYTLGREDTNYLVPHLIGRERFETEILDKMPTDYIRNRVLAFYTLQDPEGKSDRIKKQMLEKYPITATMAVYALPDDTTTREIKVVEDYIKTYCPDYTFDELAKDHAETGYVAKTVTEAVFKLSLEYTINEDGSLEVNLPANGIRFDSDLYSLTDILVLPYMGASDTGLDGYLFLPDGSGALIEYAKVSSTNATITNSVYGTDYAYQTITASASRQTMTLPVFGGVETYVGERYLGSETAEVEKTDEKTGEVTTETVTVRRTEPLTEGRGYVAILEEGDSLASITAVVGGALHKYATVYSSFNPCPRDTYEVSGAIAGSENTSLPVTSTRKYTGNFKIRYILLCDDAVAAKTGAENTYDTTWLGMAQAYRDYLEKNGTLTRLTEQDIDGDIPLYIETLGSVKTTEKVLSMPVTVSKALTSFADVKTISDELKAAGIGKMNFRLTGYANGGLESTAPARLKWEKAVGGADGFRDLLAYARENGIGIYPDFDFVYLSVDKMFDGVSFSRDVSKTINDRYAAKQEYSDALQAWKVSSSFCLSSAVFDTMYEKFSSYYKAYNPMGISASTLGSDLNSDFDEDDPYIREDAKKYTTELLARMEADTGSVMTDAGNAYVLGYADHLLNVALDSSDYLTATATVPFVGVVLHGYVEFAGSPINMAGDIGYEVLRALENGASPYFIISYTNNDLIKEHASQYYSIRYDIWKEEMITVYQELNELLAGVQTSRIVGHEFLEGERIPGEDEVAEEKKLAEEALAEALAKAQEEAYKQALADMRARYEAGKIPAGQKVEIGEVTVDESAITIDRSRYVSNDNRIVRVTYENGTSFLLNYNNFDVTVTIDGEDYAVDAYGYVVLSKGGANA